MSEPAENGGGSVRPIGRPFQPGQSGNPGRPAQGIARAFRDAMVRPEEAARGLLEIARTAKRPADRIAAWRELLDRAHGKAPAFAVIEADDPPEPGEIARESKRSRTNGARGADPNATGNSVDEPIRPCQLLLFGGPLLASGGGSRWRRWQRAIARRVAPLPGTGGALRVRGGRPGRAAPGRRTGDAPLVLVRARLEPTHMARFRDQPQRLWGGGRSVEVDTQLLAFRHRGRRRSGTRGEARFGARGRRVPAAAVPLRTATAAVCRAASGRASRPRGGLGREERVEDGVPGNDRRCAGEQEHLEAGRRSVLRERKPRAPEDARQFGRGLMHSGGRLRACSEPPGGAGSA